MGYRNHFNGTKEPQRIETSAAAMIYAKSPHVRGEKWKCGVCGKECGGKEALRIHRWSHAY